MNPTRLLSTLLGIAAGLITLGVTVGYLDAWSRPDSSLRLLPQTAFFLGRALVALVGVVMIAAALRRPGKTRAIAMTTIATFLLVGGAVAGGALDPIGVRFFYAGVLGMIGAATALSDAPTPWRSALAGLLGSIALLVSLNVVHALVERWFP